MRAGSANLDEVKALMAGSANRVPALAAGEAEGAIPNVVLMCCPPHCCRQCRSFVWNCRMPT
jgi:hypothetical protein